MSAQAPSARAAPDRRSSTVPKRTSLLPKPSSIVLDGSVLIAQHAQLTGTYPITIAANVVLHPHSRISSALAPVVLGEGCVVYERAKVGFGMGAETDAESKRSSMASSRNSTSTRDSLRGEGTVLGTNVVVESNAVVEAAEVGEGSVIEVGALLGRGCIIGKVGVFLHGEFSGSLTCSSIAPSLPHRSYQQIRDCQTIRSCSVARSNALIGHCRCDLRYSRRRWQSMQSSWTCSRN